MLNTTQKTQEASDLDVAIGLLTIEQTAAKLAPYFPAGADAVLLTNRLIARGSLPMGTIGTERRITVEALTAFLKGGGKSSEIRKSFEIPEETIRPLFPITNGRFASPWEYQADKFAQSISQELQRQLPITIDGLKSLEYLSKSPVEAELRKKLDTLFVKTIDGYDQYSTINLQHFKRYTGIPNQINIDISAFLTPELMSIISAPVPASEGALTVADASAFKGVAEIYLAQKFHWYVLGEVNKRGRGIMGLYDSNEAYKSIAEAGANTWQRNSDISSTKNYSLHNPAATTSMPWIRITMSISDFGIMKLAGTNAARIFALAL